MDAVEEAMVVVAMDEEEAETERVGHRMVGTTQWVRPSLGTTPRTFCRPL